MIGIRKIFSGINWKIVGILVFVPFFLDFLDYFFTGRPPYEDFEDFSEIFLEVLFLGGVGIYISHRKNDEKKAEKDLREKKEILQFLTDFSDSTSCLDIERVVQNALELTSERLGYKRLSVTRYEEDNKRFRLLGVKDDGSVDLKRDTYLETKNSVLSEVLTHKSPCYRPDIAAVAKKYPVDSILTEAGIKSDFIVPLINDNNCLGTLNVGSEEIDGITENDRNLLSLLAPHLAITLRNSILFENLQESEDKLRLIGDSAQDAIIIIDHSENISYWNPGAQKIFGYTSAEAVGNNAWRMLAPESDHNKYSYGFKSFQKTGKGDVVGNIVELTARRKDGTEFPIELSASAIKQQNKLDVIAIVRDITRRRQAEDAHLQNLRFVQNLIDTIPIPIYYTDAEGRYRGGNTAWSEKIVGLPAHDIIGRTVYELPEQFSQETAKKNQDSDMGLIANPGIDFYEQPVRCADGIVREFIFNKATYYDSSGEVAGIVGIMLNITERKKMEEQLARIQKLESLSVLAGGIAHDFNNLISAILLNIELATNLANRDSKQYNYLVEGQKAIMRAQQITEQLLTFSKGGSPVKTPESIEAIIRDSADFVLHGSKNMVEYHIAKDLKLANVDQCQISQVIQNLVINADQAMPKKGVISINAENTHIPSHDLLPAGNYIKVSISDQGLGIPEKHIKNIFDPYFSTKQKGSGLGLAIVYSIVKAHGGDITVDSVLGGGAVFTLYLPSTEINNKEKNNMNSEHHFGTGQRILILEDEKIIGTAMVSVLEMSGYNPELVLDGESALELYKKRKEQGNPFDVVITDLTIPGTMNGEEVNRSILDFDADARTIVSSGYINDPVMQNYKDYGYRGVLQKPINIEQLKSVVYNILKDAPPGAA